MQSEKNTYSRLLATPTSASGHQTWRTHGDAVLGAGGADDDEGVIADPAVEPDIASDGNIAIR